MSAKPSLYLGLGFDMPYNFLGKAHTQPCILAFNMNTSPEANWMKVGTDGMNTVRTLLEVSCHQFSLMNPTQCLLLNAHPSALNPSIHHALDQLTIDTGRIQDPSEAKTMDVEEWEDIVDDKGHREGPDNCSVDLSHEGGEYSVVHEYHCHCRCVHCHTSEAEVSQKTDQAH